MKYDKLKFIYLIVIALLLVTKAQAQFSFSANDTNFYDMVNRFYSDSLNTQDTSEGGFATEFRRFEDFWRPRIAPSGSFKIAGEARLNYIQSHFNSSSSLAPRLANLTDNWKPLGPYGTSSLPNPFYEYTYYAPHSRGNGRMTRLAIDPDNSTTGVYSSAWNGGLWGGSWALNSSSGLYSYNWTPLSDNLPLIGNSDVALVTEDISSVHHKYIFICSGPNSSSWRPSIELGLGVYRSDNGGAWQAITNGMIPLGSFLFKNINIWRLLPDPNPVKVGQLYAATDLGVFKTSNADVPDPDATSIAWVVLSSLKSISIEGENFRGLAFKPGNPSTSVVYASGRDVYRSIDEGSTWTSLGFLDALIAQDGFTDPSEWVNIEATQSGSVDMLYAHVYNYDAINKVGYQEIWKFDDTKSTSPWSKLGVPDCGAGGCSADHLAIAVPNDDMIYVGTTILDRGTSSDGGSNWTFGEIDGYYAAEIHADMHDLKFDGNGNLLIACDGGIYKSTNPLEATPVFTDVSDDLQVSTILGMGTSPTNPNVIIIGQQDCGVVFTKNATETPNSWTQVRGGDGAQCLVDNLNPDIMYTTQVLGSGPSQIEYTTNGFASPSSNIGEPDVQGTFVASHRIGPKDNTLYSSVNDIWKWDGILNGWQTNDRKSEFWTSNSPYFGCGDYLESMAFAPSDQNYMYASVLGVLCSTPACYIFKSTSGGGIGNTCGQSGTSACWTNVTPPDLFTDYDFDSSPTISGIAVSATDPNHVYFTCSGYVHSLKVFESLDGGDNWANISGGIDDNLPVNCIVYEKGSNDGIYIGTDDGVYYKNNTMSTFQPFFDNKLPHVIVLSLEINYANNVIRAGTYGRGVWESPLVCPDEVNAANYDLTLTALVGSSPEFDESTGTLTASTVTIPSGRKVTYRATEEIDLLPGFVAQPGSNFRAFIHGCEEGSGNSNPLRKSNPNSQPKNTTLLPVSTDLFSVYPNPNEGTFHLSMSAKDQTLKDIFIFNVFGKQVYENLKTDKSDLDFDISQNAKGVYLVKVVGEGKVSVSRIVFM